MRIFTSAILAAAILFVGSAVWAGEPDNMQGMSGMSGMKMDHMMGMHEMTATVNGVDSKTGLVEVTAGGMALKVHFPPAALANVKAGDSITLHLGFTKP